MSPQTSASWIGTHWGEIAAFAALAAAVWHVVRKVILKKSKDSNCCKTGCSALGRKNDIDNRNV